MQPSPTPPAGARTAAFTLAALVSFAANSWLCRAALRGGAIDPATFTAVRLGCGAAALALCLALAPGATGNDRGARGGWLSAGALFLYAIAFALAYLRLDAGVGALVLFGSVQTTMLVGGILAGHRPHWAESTGLVVAFAGFLRLAAPGEGSPDPLALAGMSLAGFAWGLYSLRGRGERRPLAANAGNFLRAAPLGIACVGLAVVSPPVAVAAAHATGPGLLLAAVSGAVTSGLGYAAWYAALPGLSPLLAGLVQLAVPVLAAAGGVVLLGEQATLRLLGAGALVLAGIALAAFGPRLAGAAT